MPVSRIAIDCPAPVASGNAATCKSCRMSVALLPHGVPAGAAISRRDSNGSSRQAATQRQDGGGGDDERDVYDIGVKPSFSTTLHTQGTWSRAGLFHNPRASIDRRP